MEKKKTQIVEVGGTSDRVEAREVQKIKRNQRLQQKVILGPSFYSGN